MNGAQTLKWLEKEGLALQSGKGPLPRIVDAIAGEPIKGSWWGHPSGKAIFNTLEELMESGQVLCCRLCEGKITLIHARLWPALVVAAGFLTKDQVAVVRQEHTASGAHRNVVVPFPEWVPPDVMKASKRVSEEQARELFGAFAKTRRTRT